MAVTKGKLPSWLKDGQSLLVPGKRPEGASTKNPPDSKVPSDKEANSGKCNEASAEQSDAHDDEPAV